MYIINITCMRFDEISNLMVKYLSFTDQAFEVCASWIQIVEKTSLFCLNLNLSEFLFIFVTIGDSKT